MPPSHQNDASSSMLLALPVPAFIFDLQERRFLFMNELFADLMGYSEAELMAMTLDEIRPPEDLGLFHKALHEQPPEGAIRWRYITKDKRLLFVTLKYRNMTHAHNGRAIPARFVVVTDQSDQPPQSAEEVYAG